MPLTAGARLGPYEILEPIGKGGMGEVYRARDTKLDRDVAIKVLPEEFASDPERLARFEREAKLLASLNHPNIASIHGFEESDGVNALVLELVEGPTLAERIEQGPIPVNEALAIAKQIAEALEAGHEAGVVHRDLKPANIKLKEDGTVKVLDYGLAKALEDETPAAADSEISQSPTLTRQGTQVGVILGTAAYMSPEQAKGNQVDKRADVWAYGAVVYEMLTGERAFGGEGVSEILAHVLTKEPRWEALPKETPGAVRQVLGLCLNKDARGRARDIGDVLLAMGGAFETAAVVEPASMDWRSSIKLAVIAALAFGIIAGVVGWNLKPEAAGPIVRSSLDLPPGALLTATYLHHAVALSPDGSRLVFSANEQLYIRSMDETEVAPVRGTEGGAAEPFFSPDGEWVGFWANGQLKKVAISGGAAVSLCEAQFPFGARWEADGTVVFGQRAGILRVFSEGGTPEVLVPLEVAGEIGHGPQLLPGGEAVLFTLGVVGNWDNAQIVVQDIESGERKVLLERGRDARYISTGHLVYVLDGTILAVPFDVGSLEVTGGPVPMVESVMTSGGITGAAHFSVSDTGSLVYVSGDAGERTLVWVDRQGREEALAAEPRGYYGPDVSPDGRRVALSVADEEGENIWIHDLTRNTLTRLTFDPARGSMPRWSPDGRRIVFSSLEAGVANLFWKASDGTGAVERLTSSSNRQYPTSWSSDGQHLLFFECGGACDLWVLSLDGEATPEPLLQTEEFTEWNAALSPDGRWFAYDSDASGRREVYVRPFPDAESGLQQVSTSGGQQPLWAPDGGELFYWGSDGVMRVSYETEPTFTAGNPELLFEHGAYLYDGRRNYAMAPDGERFLMIKESGTSSTKVILVQNWHEELKRLVPVE